MRMLKVVLILLTLLVTINGFGQSLETLRSKLQTIVASKNARVGVAINGPGQMDTLSWNGGSRFPMQSVFKFHIALAVLTEVDKGAMSLTQKVKIEKKDLLPGLYSPLREKYPEGATLTIAEILEYTVSLSDNVGCDALLRLLGGPTKVESFFHEKGFTDIAIRINEEVMQGNWDLQFQNWTTPRQTNKILAAFYVNKNLLSKKSYNFIWKVMRETSTGRGRLKGKLPEGTVVAHKTGFSGTNDEGITAAVNDVGIIFLPGNRPVYISVFVSDSKEDVPTSETIIADIAKLVWDHYSGGK